MFRSTLVLEELFGFFGIRENNVSPAGRKRFKPPRIFYKRLVPRDFL